MVGIRVFSLCLLGFPLSAPASSNTLKTCRLLQTQNSPQVWSVSFSMCQTCDWLPTTRSAAEAVALSNSYWHEELYIRVNEQPAVSNQDAKGCVACWYQMPGGVTNHHYLMHWYENDLNTVLIFLEAASSGRLRYCMTEPVRVIFHISAWWLLYMSHGKSESNCFLNSFIFLNRMNGSLRYFFKLNRNVPLLLIIAPYSPSHVTDRW